MKRSMLTLVTLAACLTTYIGSAKAGGDAQAADDAAKIEAQKTEKVALRKALASQRKINLERFHAYRVKRVYPHNTYEPGQLNVWKDEDGHLCAVATLVHNAGLDNLVEQTAKDNFFKVADLTDGPVLEWALTSGLTQEELAMIQQPTEADIAQEEALARREKRRIKRWLKREDNRLESNYRLVERTLAAGRIAEAGLDIAVARLMHRDDLAAIVLGNSAVHQVAHK
jgi:hypothetical protein